METYSRQDMEKAGIDVAFVQDNQSLSVKGVLRGLHFQKQYLGIPEKRDARSALAGRSFRLKRDTRCKKLLTEQ